MTLPTLALALSISALVQAQPPAPKVLVHTYTAGPTSYDANAFWLESESGLVLIDALLLKSEARLLAAQMKATGKPLAGIILTHPHLDHFGGIRTVVSAYGKVPVYATKATADAVKPTHERAMALGWPQALGDDYDRDPFVPDTIVEPGTVLDLGGMRLVIRDYGPIEAANNSVVHNLDLNVLFMGDATVAHAPVYVGEGHSKTALEALPRIVDDFPKVARAYSGHYGPMRLEPLVAANLTEIRYDRAVIRRLIADPANLTEKGELTKEARVQAVRALASHAREGSTYGLNPVTMAQMNAAGLEPELLAESKGKETDPLALDLSRRLGRLQFLTGRWAGPVVTPAAPNRPDGTPPRSSEAQVSFRTGPGGASIEGEVRFAGVGYRAVLSYDLFRKTYRSTFVDDATGLLDVYEGDFDESGSLVQTNLRSGTYFPRNQEKVFSRLTLTPGIKESWHWTIETSTDGGATWTPGQDFEASARLP